MPEDLAKSVNFTAEYGEPNGFYIGIYYKNVCDMY